MTDLHHSRLTTAQLHCAFHTEPPIVEPFLQNPWHLHQLHSLTEAWHIAHFLWKQLYAVLYAHCYLIRLDPNHA
uniref:Kch5 n=1 Tax=Arundo donax TaxID=35708 RepID=A0A0A9EKU3_ARUDO